MAAGSGSGAHRRTRRTRPPSSTALLAPLLPAVGDRELVIVPSGRRTPCRGDAARVRGPAAVGRAVRRAVAPRPRARRPLACGRARRCSSPGPGSAEAGTAEVAAIGALYDGAIGPHRGGRRRRGRGRRAGRMRPRRPRPATAASATTTPLFSALLLADGPLTVHDVEVLGAARAGSRCPPARRGAQRRRAGDAMGLTAALLAIGAGVIVADTVDVPDAPTAADWPRCTEPGGGRASGPRSRSPRRAGRRTATTRPRRSRATPSCASARADEIGMIRARPADWGRRFLPTLRRKEFPTCPSATASPGCACSSWSAARSPRRPRRRCRSSPPTTTGSVPAQDLRGEAARPDTAGAALDLRGEAARPDTAGAALDLRSEAARDSSDFVAQPSDPAPAKAVVTAGDR